MDTSLSFSELQLPFCSEGHPWSPTPVLSGSLVAQLVKESACAAGDPSLIPELGKFPGEGNGNPLHYSCLGNPTDRRIWWATVHGVTKELNTTHQLNNKNHLSFQTLIFRNFFLDIPNLKPEFKKQRFMSEHHRRWKHMLWFSLPHPFTPLGLLY